MTAEERAAFLALFRRLEWSGEGKRYDDGSRTSVCPVCRHGELHGHHESCELERCIKAMEGGQQP